MEERGRGGEERRRGGMSPMLLARACVRAVLRVRVLSD